MAYEEKADVIADQVLKNRNVDGFNRYFNLFLTDVRDHAAKSLATVHGWELVAARIELENAGLALCGACTNEVSPLLVRNMTPEVGRFLLLFLDEDEVNTAKLDLHMLVEV